MDRICGYSGYYRQTKDSYQVLAASLLRNGFYVSLLSPAASRLESAFSFVQRDDDWKQAGYLDALEHVILPYRLIIMPIR